MFSQFNQSKQSPFKFLATPQKEPSRLSGTIINSSSVSNEEFFMLLQEIGDFQSQDQLDSSNTLSLQDGQIQIQFRFLSKMNLNEKQQFSKSDIIILLLNIDQKDIKEQFKFIEDYLHFCDENNYDKKNSQLFFFVQNFSFKIHENNDFEYQISELLTEYPYIANCKVSSDNSSTLNQLLKPKIIQFTQKQEQQLGWSPILTNEQDQYSLQKTSRNVLDQLDQYKQTRQVSQSPPPVVQKTYQPSLSPPPMVLQPRQASQSPPPAVQKSRKSVFENPIIFALKQQQEEKKMQEDMQKSLIDLQNMQQSGMKSASKIMSASNIQESPEQSLISKKRDTNQSIMYYNSSSKRFDNDSPLSTLRYRDDEKDYNHKIKVKMSPFRQEICTSYQYPKLSGEKQPPVFKTSLIQGDNQDYLVQKLATKISRSSSPNGQQVSQQGKEIQEKNILKQNNQQNYLDVSINQQNLKKQINQGEIKLNKYSEIPRSTTPSKFIEKLNLQNQNEQKLNELRRNKSSLGIRQSNTIMDLERSLTPNKLGTRKIQKQVVTSSTPSQNCILKLNIEIQNKIVQLEVEEQDTSHTLTYKLLQKCNSSGQLKQVKQISQVIEQKLKKYLQNVEKYFKNYSKPQVTHICKQNKQILQDLIDNDYQELQKKKKATQNYLYQGLDRSYSKYNIQNSNEMQYEMNNRPSSALAMKNNFQMTQFWQNPQQANKYIGEIQIQGDVNGKLQNISMLIEENTLPDVQAQEFLKQNNLSIDLKDSIVQQIQQIITQHKQANTFSDIFQENREQISFIKELKSKYRFDNNVLFQSIQKSQAKINHFRVNLELENGKTVKFNFNDTDNLSKAINIFCINHKLSSKNQQKLYSICEQSIKYHKELQNKKRQQ
ncbi:hypothetical protein ABPG74_022702 [Tetrahymena malaccensis]